MRARPAGWFAAAGIALPAPAAGAQIRGGFRETYSKEWPLHYMGGDGPIAGAIAELTWGLLGLSVFVVLVISALVILGVMRRARRAVPGEWPAVSRSESGLNWIWIGLGLTTLALAGAIAWSTWTISAIAEPPDEPRLTVEVVGQQWWWEVRYRSAQNPDMVFETANEIHIPVGEPVRLEFRSTDVIHSFWIPSLAGKTDLIPGQTNSGWIQADRPGTYFGKCMEYCGQQHANMSLRLIARPPEEFAEWALHQLEEAPDPQTEAQELGRTLFNANCGACHAVRGNIYAGGDLGPDLTHVMSRQTLAAGALPNTIGHLSGWIANPQVLKPGSRMPDPDIAGSDLALIRAYVLTLQ